MGIDLEENRPESSGTWLKSGAYDSLQKKITERNRIGPEMGREHPTRDKLRQYLGFGCVACAVTSINRKCSYAVNS